MKLGVIILIAGLFLLSACGSLPSRYHQVKAGDTLKAIADTYGVSTKEIRRANKKVLNRGWFAGAKIYIPYESRSDWNSNQIGNVTDRSPSSDGRYGDEPLAFNLSQARFTWPVAGVISSTYGPRHGRMHEGLDIAAPHGTMVKAARGGKVIYASNKISGYGNMVIGRHSDTFATVYAHLSKIHVKAGQLVQRAAQLGRVGKTGHASGPHLHFEIRNRRTPVDPLQYLTRQLASK